ncbi:hypothetical protein ACFPM3_06110 [Streptomyces coeruleoprunus]|uniref:Uncharacterized protein n=1 Tax=Streptomyces coeruleoprunus TaxID=285563 RepID=A0ABV9X8E1_9ACTN
MTPTTMRPGPIGAQRTSETVPRSAMEPIFTELARRWEQAGRTVPGRHDPEWARLARRSPWPPR